MDSIFAPDAQHNNTRFKIIAGLDRIAQALRAQMWACGKAYGLTPIQLQCLVFIRHHDAAKRRTSHLAREFDVTPATISQAIRTLLQKGYLTRQKLDSDARVQILNLSAAGEKLCEEIDSWANALLPHLDGLSAEQAPVVLRFLMDFIASLHSAGAISVARQCTTCRFFKATPDTGTFYCKLLERDMSTTDLRIDCPEHELP